MCSLCLTLCFILAQFGKVSRQRLWMVTLHAGKNNNIKAYTEHTCCIYFSLLCFRPCPPFLYVCVCVSICLSACICVCLVSKWLPCVSLYSVCSCWGAVFVLLTRATECLLGSNTLVTCCTECGSRHCQWGEEVAIAVTCLPFSCCLLSLPHALSLFILEKK